MRKELQRLIMTEKLLKSHHTNQHYNHQHITLLLPHKLFVT